MVFRFVWNVLTDCTGLLEAIIIQRAISQTNPIPTVARTHPFKQKIQIILSEIVSNKNLFFNDLKTFR